MSSRVTSYTTLVSAVLEAAEDTGTELQAFLPTAIDNAENKLFRELDIIDTSYTSAITVAPSTATFSKPSGHRATYHLEYLDPTTNRRAVLRHKTDDYLAEYWPQSTSVGTPVYYADKDQNTFTIAPCCSTSATFTVVGLRRPTPLTASASTNVFTSVAADALFYATMIEVAVWQRNDVLLNNYAQLYVASRDALNNEGRRGRRDDGTPPGNSESGQNTLKGDN